MKVLKAEFILSAFAIDDCPETDLPEIAITGRSNVGKSTLINFITTRKGIAQTSKTPGKTRALNFFNINDQFMLVDTPGYGYAKGGLAHQAKWATLIESYLKHRTNLKGVLALLDSRRLPSDKDIALFEWLAYYNINTKILLTKIDKISKNKRASQKAKIFKLLPPLNIGQEDLIDSSALKKIGKSSILSNIKDMILADHML
ncbi:MAG: ribosome biogenesis GTP-binding protein YihA/YsxC [Nitrospinota bacterium]